MFLPLSYVYAEACVGNDLEKILGIIQGPIAWPKKSVLEIKVLHPTVWKMGQCYRLLYFCIIPTLRVQLHSFTVITYVKKCVLFTAMD